MGASDLQAVVLHRPAKPAPAPEGRWSVEAIQPAIGTPHGLGHRLDPATHGTDGFFVACLRAPC